MKVLLINPPSGENSVARDMAGGLGFKTGRTVVLPPLELAYMAATLLGKGHQVKILDYGVEVYSQEILKSVLAGYDPDTVIATVSLPALYNDCGFLRHLRGISSAQIIAKSGIAHASLLREILEKSAADFCIFGECDLNIEEIIKRETRKGTAYFESGELKVEENIAVENLDDLPVPARGLLENGKYRYVLLGERVTAMQTSRGCPFPCAFYCPYPLVQGKSWRARSPGHVIEEIEDAVNNHQIKKIIFRDATFTLDNQRTQQICDLITQRRLDIQWWCESRVDCLNRQLMGKMKEAGCQGMNIGVETGCPEVMETQAKIGLTLDKLQAFRRDAKELGLRVHFLLMIGLPQETLKTVYQTYKLVSGLQPESIGVTIVTPYPGTPLYEEAKRKNWVETADWNKYDGQSAVMHTDNLTSAQITKLRKYLYKGFNLSASQDWLSRFQSFIFDMLFKGWAGK